MARLIIKSHRPWQLAIAIIILSMVISLFTWLLLDNNHWQVIYGQLSGNTDTRELIEANQGLQDENKALQGRILMLDQTTQLDKQTAVIMQNELKALQDQIYQLKRELEFYQGVMDTNQSVSGLEIHGIYIEPLSKSNQFLIKLVLTNVTLSDRLLQGSLEIMIEGDHNGTKQSLNMSKLLIDERVELSFELKNFKRVEYRFELPSEFNAERVIVKVSQNNRNEPPISGTYDWPLN